MTEKMIKIVLPDGQQCYLPTSVVEKYRVPVKPIALTNSFSQEYEISTVNVEEYSQEYEMTMTQETVFEETFEASVEIEEEILPMEAPKMVKVATIEHDDIDMDETDNVSVVSSVDVSSVSEFPLMFDDDGSESGFEVEEPVKEAMITRQLAVYVTKVPMTVRSDCTKDAPVIHKLARGERIHVLENGIENFPTARLCHWWRKTFAGENMNRVPDFCRRYGVTGKEMAELSATLRMELGFNARETETVRKALKLVKRKAQVVFFDDEGVAHRGWISKVKKGKQTVSRIFNDSTPALVVRKMDNRGRSVERCERDLNAILEKHDVDYDVIKFGMWFDEFRAGKEVFIRNGRVRHGKWKPENHCLINFSSYREAAVALKKLSTCNDLDYCVVDFAREYANLTEVTFPKF